MFTAKLSSILRLEQSPQGLRGEGGKGCGERMSESVVFGVKTFTDILGLKNIYILRIFILKIFLDDILEKTGK